MPASILEYQERFGQAHAALYRWDVWAAAYLIGGDCSDDSFIDFRAGIIAQGRDWYEKTAASPDNPASHPAVTRRPAATRHQPCSSRCEAGVQSAPAVGCLAA
jgi:hypothetical protein